MNAMDGRLSAAEAMLEAGNFMSAERHLEQVFELDTGNISAFELMFRLLLKQGKKEQARELAETWAVQHPGNATVRTHNVVAQILCGRQEEARQALAAFKERFPDQSELIAPLEKSFNSKFQTAPKAGSKIEAIQEKYRTKAKAGAAGVNSHGTSQHAAGADQAQRVVEEDGLESAEAMKDDIHQAFRAARLCRMRRLAIRLARTHPRETDFAREVILVSKIGMIPPFFLAQVWLSLWRMLFGYVGMLGMLVFGAALMAVIGVALIGVPAVLFHGLMAYTKGWQIYLAVSAVWVSYSLFFFGDMGKSFSNSSRQVQLKPNF